MQELEKMISIYHTANIVCLVLAISFLAISVILFFRFDIKKIFDLKTGRGAKKTIQKMEEINARTGKLRQDMVAQTPSNLKAEERIVRPVKTEEPNETAPLAVNGSEDTMILQQESETTVLSNGMETNSKEEKRELPGNFKVIKEIMWVHTKEVL